MQQSILSLLNNSPLYVLLAVLLYSFFEFHKFKLKIISTQIQIISENNQILKKLSQILSDLEIQIKCKNYVRKKRHIHRNESTNPKY